MSPLIGLAVLGKANEPLYLCDCQRLLQSKTPKPSEEPVEDVMAKGETVGRDQFGFEEMIQNRGWHASLPIPFQFMIHSAVDNVDEMVDTGNASLTSSAKASMPVQRRTSAVASTLTAGSPHWLGLLLEEDDSEHVYAIYGYITATNIKLLALIQRGNKVDVSSVKNFLTAIHDHYVAYVMNPFRSLHGPLQSRYLDEQVRAAAAEYDVRSNSRVEV